MHCIHINTPTPNAFSIHVCGLLLRNDWQIDVLPIKQVLLLQFFNWNVYRKGFIRSLCLSVSVCVYVCACVSVSMRECGCEGASEVGSVSPKVGITLLQSLPFDNKKTLKCSWLSN